MKDEELRQKRLVFYQEDLVRIDRMLKDFLDLSKGKCALLIDKDGHLVTRQGMAGTFNLDTISALVAGSYAATKEMARLLGEEEFSVLFHQGKKDNIQLSLVGDRTLLAVIFDERTTVGMVRLYSTEVAKKLSGLFNDITTRKAGTGGTEQIDKKFGEAASGRLDDLFGK